jgi:CheY-like chemotaxis protein
LVVDDNQSFITLFCRYLSGTGWQVVGAHSGSEAEQILTELLSTVIILDGMMPQEDGWELLRRWRVENRTAAVPIIICSVLSEPHLALTLGGFFPNIRVISRHIIALLAAYKHRCH